MLAQVDSDPVLRRATIAACRADVVTFVRDWCWTYDPRVPGGHIPLEPWPKQVEFLRWLEAREADHRQGLVEKSRDAGITYLCAAFALHRWLFRPGFQAVFGSNKEESVDNLGDPGSIFEKIRIILRFLPRWLLPEGFSFEAHAIFRRIVNPVTGNVLIGQAGDEIGRGGRASILFIDEAAHLARPMRVNAATAATAKVRILVSSVNGMGNWFAQARHDGSSEVFVFDWRDDPRKTEDWAAGEKKRIGSLAWAQEYDRDYGASVEGLLIVKSWIDAAVRIGEMVEMPVTGLSSAGLDVGAGKDLSVFIARTGSVIHAPVEWRNPDTIDLANNALAEAGRLGVEQLVYDSVGVGHGVSSVLSRVEGGAVYCVPCNTGEPASEQRLWPDGRTSRERFKNSRAELWWLLREALHRTYEMVLFLEGEDGGVEHPLDQCLSLPNHQQLRTELNVLTWFYTSTGQIQMESKDKLRARGIKSPDFADALALTFLEPQREKWTSQHILVGGRLTSAQPGWRF